MTCYRCGLPTMYSSKAARCPRCLDYHRKKGLLYFRRDREKILQRQNNRRQRFRVERRCIDCGISLVEGEGTRCVTHTDAYLERRGQ